MNHLTDDQLSALLDGALAPAERTACDAHLAACEACRAQLAELSSLDAALEPALTHDPGEAYFATFADRVGARIAAGGATGAAPGDPAGARTTAPRRSPWTWLLSPRGLSLAGGTAALIATAGLAWMQFQHNESAIELHARAPRPADVRHPEQGAPMRTGDAVAPPAVTAPDLSAAEVAPAPAASALQSRDERLPAGRADAGTRRAREMKSLDEGAPVPVRDETQRQQPALPLPPISESHSVMPRADEQGNSAPAQEPAPVTAQMKQRAMAKESEAPAPKPVERSLWSPAKQLFPAPQSPAASPSASAPTPVGAARKDPLAPDFAKVSEQSRNEVQPRGGSSDPQKLELAQASPLSVQCGTVADTRGTPVRGVQITLLGATTRSSRSAPDGSFCLPRAVAGDTLVLMHVGFEPVRVVLTPSTSLAFGLEPVGTLGPRDGMFMGGKTQGFMKLSPPPAGPAAADRAPAAEVYAGQSDTVRTAVVAARKSTAFARREHTAAGWESAAASWDGVAALASGQAGYAARFQSLSALREAWLLTPAPARRERLQAALAAFVAATPRTLPERAAVQRWLGELGTRPPR